MLFSMPFQGDIIRTNIQPLRRVNAQGNDQHMERASMNILSQKHCRTCEEWKDRTEFNKDRDSKDGLNSQCRICHSIAGRKYRQDNREKVLSSKRRYSELNKEKISGRRRNWYLRNAEKVIEKVRARYLENPEKTKQRVREWAKNNPEKVRERSVIREHTRRARINGNGGKITKHEWRVLKEFYNYTCLCCKRQEPGIKLTLDHIKPIARGGSNTIDNVQPLCDSCNKSKGVKCIDYRTATR